MDRQSDTQTITVTVADVDEWPDSGWDEAVFGRDDGVNGYELFISDVLREALKSRSDIRPGPDSSFPGYAKTVASSVYFYATTERTTRTLETRQRAAGVAHQGHQRGRRIGQRAVRRFYPDVRSQRHAAVHRVADTATCTPSSKSDAFVGAFTVLIADIRPGFSDPGISQLTQFGNHRYLIGDQRHRTASSCGAPTAPPRWSRTSGPAITVRGRTASLRHQHGAVLHGERQHQRHRPWTSGRTSGGTVMVANIEGTNQAGASGPIVSSTTRCSFKAPTLDGANSGFRMARRAAPQCANVNPLDVNFGSIGPIVAAGGRSSWRRMAGVHGTRVVGRQRDWRNAGLRHRAGRGQDDHFAHDRVG